MKCGNPGLDGNGGRGGHGGHGGMVMNMCWVVMGNVRGDRGGCGERGEVTTASVCCVGLLALSRATLY